MTKTKEQLLLDYKKSNKQRRIKIIQKAGFTTESEYFTFLSEPFKVKKKRVNKKDNGTLDMVIAFDVTGSMSAYIDNVKNYVQNLIPELFDDNPDLKLKIVAFGDYCDMINYKDFGNAYQETNLLGKNHQNKLIKFVNAVQYTSGGDSDEFYELVIKKIVEETPWRKGKRAVLLIADSLPHQVGYSYNNIIYNNQIDWREEAKKAASMNIKFDTLTIGKYGYASFYEELSKLTNGVSMPFVSSENSGELIKAVTSVRGSSVSKMKYAAMADSAFRSGDEELIGMYKSLSKEL